MQFQKGDRVRFYSWPRNKYIQGVVTVTDGDKVWAMWQNVDFEGHTFETWMQKEKLEGLELRFQK